MLHILLEVGAERKVSELGTPTLWWKNSKKYKLTWTPSHRNARCPKWTIIRSASCFNILLLWLKVNYNNKNNYGEGHDGRTERKYKLTCHRSARCLLSSQTTCPPPVHKVVQPSPNKISVVTNRIVQVRKPSVQSFQNIPGNPQYQATGPCESTHHGIDVRRVTKVGKEDPWNNIGYTNSCHQSDEDWKYYCLEHPPPSHVGKSICPDLFKPYPPGIIRREDPLLKHDLFDRIPKWLLMLDQYIGKKHGINTQHP